MGSGRFLVHHWLEALGSPNQGEAEPGRLLVHLHVGYGTFDRVGRLRERAHQVRRHGCQIRLE